MTLQDYIKLAESREFSAEAFDKMRLAIPAMAQALIEAEEVLLGVQRYAEDAHPEGKFEAVNKALSTIQNLKEIP